MHIAHVLQGLLVLTLFQSGCSAHQQSFTNETPFQEGAMDELAPRDAAEQPAQLVVWRTPNGWLLAKTEGAVMVSRLTALTDPDDGRTIWIERHIFGGGLLDDADVPYPCLRLTPIKFAETSSLDEAIRAFGVDPKTVRVIRGTASLFALPFKQDQL